LTGRRPSHRLAAKEDRVPLTYGDYLKVDDLLALQVPQSDRPEHDELLFIVIHQVYELWFKLVIHELGHLQQALEGGDTATAMATFKRILTVFKTLVGQIDILETMTPVSFLSFRDRLDTASGFQSLQFRVVEFLLGHRPTGMIHHHGEAGAVLAGLVHRPSLWDSFLRYLVHRSYAIPADVLGRDLSQPPAENDAVQKILVEIYHQDPVAREVAERMVDLDEGLQEWRYRHVKMVERTIGTKRGTGGSSGADYLRATLFKPLFPDLWAIRPAL
jgi:tryptophan 2,3-dioxygenase